jgi:DNA adenine methylase
MTASALASNPTAPPEMFWYDQARSPSVKLGMIELENGKWMALPPGFHVDAPQFETRDAALRTAIAQTIRKTRRFMRAGEGQGTHYSEGYGGRIIEWAMSIAPPRGQVSVLSDVLANIDQPFMSTAVGIPITEKQIPIQVASGADAAPIDHPGTEDEAKPIVDGPLLTAKGRAPVNSYFACHGPDDGEWHIPEDDRLRGVDRQIGLLELNNGNWMSHPDGLMTYSRQFPSREAALRSAIAKVIWYQRLIVRDRKKLPSSLNRGDAPEVIAWALSLNPGRDGAPAAGPHLRTGLVEGAGPNTTAPAGPQPLEEINPPANAANDLEAKTASEEITPPDTASADDRVIEDSPSAHSGGLKQPLPTDPIVASLVAAHRARKTFPDGHTFAMTNPIINGHMVTLGTCSCGDVFSYTYGSYERMDAAIEAHWQTFDHLPAKIDGRGNPINADGSAIVAPKAAKPKRKKSQPGAGGQQPAPPASAPLVAPVEGADVLNLAAPIGAGTETPNGDTASPPRQDTGAGQDGEASASASRPAYLLAPVEPAAVEVGCGQAPEVNSPDPFWDSPLIKAALDLAWREPPQVTDMQAKLLNFSKVYAPCGEVERPVLRWHGGKWKLAPWVMSFFPEHRIYVEPFGGAGSVLMRKLRVYAEVYNDLDDVVTNLFRVLRDDTKAARLIEALRLTPFSRAEFQEALQEAEDDVERARHLIVRSYMGFGSNAHSSSSTAEKTGFKSFTRPDEYRSTGFRANSKRSGTTPAHDWANYPDALPSIVDRLRGVIVEQRPAIDVMRQHDGLQTLHYVDPPYLPETRSPANKYDLKHRMYRHELTVDDHGELLEFLKTLKGFVVLSGYPSALYDDALPDWRRVSCDAHADGARPRTEVLWINPACASALDEQHPTLFNIPALDIANAPPPLDVEVAEPKYAAT